MYVKGEALPQMSDNDDLTMMTILYHSIVIGLYKKDIGRTGRNLQPWTLDTYDINHCLRSGITLLCGLAFRALINGMITFTSGHWDKILNHSTRETYQERP